MMVVNRHRRKLRIIKKWFTPTSLYLFPLSMGMLNLMMVMHSKQILNKMSNHVIVKEIKGIQLSKY